MESMINMITASFGVNLFKKKAENSGWFDKNPNDKAGCGNKEIK